MKEIRTFEKAIEENWYPEYEWFEDGRLETSQIDAEVSDVIVQLALFDEIVFG